MASNKTFRAGPTALTASAANLLNSTVTSLAGPVGITLTQPYLIVRHIRIVNTSAASATFNLYIGATGGSAAGTEFMGAGTSVAANAAIDWYGQVLLNAADFLTGKASIASNTLIITFEGEVGFIQ